MESTKALVLYETFTNNCMKYAEIFAQFLLCEKIRISEFSDAVTADVLIIISPVHAQTIPKKVKTALKMCNLTGRKVIAVAVYGGISCGSSLYTLSRYINKSGGTVIGAAECVAEHSYSILTGSKENIPTAADTEMMQLCNFIKTAIGQKTNLRLKSLKRYSNLFSYLPKRMLAALSVRLPIIEKHKKCTDCGLCVSECQLSAIDVKKDIIKAKCIRCLHCARICPAKARRTKFSQPFAKRYLCKKRNRKNKYYLSLPI